MSVMDRTRWRVLEPLLDRALDLPADERAAWMDELRVRSPDVAEELTALLASEAEAERVGFLVEPATATLEGLELGAWTLERPLGQGGMGTVWLARRTDGRYEGRAAIKLLNLALLTGVGQARFRREGMALARLTHHGIARLLDAGVGPGGQPYLVLEHVDGRRIDDHVRERGLGVDAIVRLVVDVLDAVAHAHANLVIHRDIKPSNILVTADGAPKLLDFGIAKLLDEGDGRAATVDGGRVFTPDFAAPEQVMGETVTTATDVWALGVLLYLLVSGRHPYAAATPHLHPEMREPAPLGHGDLDTVVRHAMRPAAAERYQSVVAFADDLRRWLRHQPVSVRRDSVAYRARKFVRRNRGGVIAALAAVAALAGATLRERSLRERAEIEGRKARAVEQYLVGIVGDVDPYRPESARDTAVTARALLDRGAARVDSMLATEPEIQAELRRVLGNVYANLGAYDRAVPLLRRSVDQLGALHGPVHPTVAAAMDQLGMALARQDRLDEADTLLRAALAQRRALFGDADSTTATSLGHLATLLQERNDYAGADSLFRQALAIQRRVLGPDHEEVGTSLNDLGLLLVVRGRLDEAEPLYRQALAAYVRSGASEARRAQTLHNLAQLEQLRGNVGRADTLYREALALKRRVFGDAHPSVTINLNNLGSMLLREDRPEEAEPLIREALALDRRMFGERHSFVAASLNGLGNVLRAKGDLAGAEQAYRDALEVNRSLLGDEHTAVALNLNNIGAVMDLKGDAAAGVPLIRRSLDLYGRALGERHGSYAAVSLNLARALRDAGRLAEAESSFRVISARLDTTRRAERATFVSAQVGLGQTLVDRGRPADALPLLERAQAMARTQYGAGDWRQGEARLALGRCLGALGEWRRAEPLLVEAAALLGPKRRAQPRLARDVDAELTRARRATATPGGR